MALRYLQQYGSTSEDEKEDEPPYTTPVIPMRKRDAQALESRRKKQLHHAVIYGSCNSCHLDCTSKVDRETRHRINVEFWRKTPSEQKSFIRQNVIRVEVKRRRINSAEHRKLFSYNYHLPNTQLISRQICGIFPANFFTCDMICKPATKLRPRPKLNDVKLIVFSRGSYNFTYGKDFTGATKSCNFFTRDQLRKIQSADFDLASTMKYRILPKGIENARKQGIIQKIVPLLPPEKKKCIGMSFQHMRTNLMKKSNIEFRY